MIAEHELPSFTQLSLRYSAVSHPGALPTNEDACLVVDAPRCSAVIIADGAGGHACGEVASALVVQSAVKYLKKLGDFEPGPATAQATLEAAQHALRDAIVSSSKRFEMRSTGLVILASKKNAWVAHVGDSRAYLIRDGKAQLLTRDDTLVQALVDIGQIDAEQARHHSKSNVLLQSLGDPKELEFHVTEALEPKVGDVLVACTDGLTEVLRDADLVALSKDGTSREIARRMMNRAVEGGAHDNVTVSVIVWKPSESATGRMSIGIAGSPRPKKRRARKGRRDFALFMGLIVVALGLLVVANLRKSRRLNAPTSSADPANR